MSKKFARFSRLFPALLIGVTITILGFAFFLSPLRAAYSITASPSAQIIPVSGSAITPSASVAPITGSIYGWNSSVVSAPITVKPGVGTVTSPNAKKLQTQCLANKVNEKNCFSDDDCTFHTCVSGLIDEKYTLRGTCVGASANGSGKCSCDTPATISQASCTESLPKCFVITDELGYSKGHQCAQCNEKSDCKDKEPICDGNTLVSYLFICNVWHSCDYDYEVRQICPIGCAIKNGKAACVGCTKASDCPNKLGICENSKKITYNKSCQNSTCVYSPKNQFCSGTSPFCYKKDAQTDATCVGCLEDSQCKSKETKCGFDKKSIDAVASTCQNFSCKGTGQAINTPCPSSNPFCQNAKCVECLSNNDCGAKLPSAYCGSNFAGMIYSAQKARCSAGKCDLSKAGTAFKCGLLSGRQTFCNNTAGKLSCVQCLSDDHCAYANGYTCEGETLVSWSGTCGNNKCNAKGKENSRQDCSASGLSCLAKKGMCGCESDSQCTDLIATKPAVCVDGSHYKNYDKTCGKDSKCGYTETIEACDDGSVCSDSGNGAKCVSCTQDSDCSFLGKKKEYQTKCSGKTVTSYTFSCQVDNNDPTTSRCVADKSDNYCEKGCYKDNNGLTRCKDCESNADCQYPFAASCSSNKLLGNYYSGGFCMDNYCVYEANVQKCNPVATTSYCKNKNTRVVTGPLTFCSIVDNNKVGCVAQTKTETCLNCRMLTKTNAICQKVGR